MKSFAYKPFSFIVNTRPYNLIYKKHIEKSINKIENSSVFINIETTNLCNADCIMCPHSIMKRKTGTMDYEIFKSIVDNAIEYGVGIREFVLSGFGEPFMDKLIFDRIRYIKSKGNYYTKLFTNASLLDKEKAVKIINSGLDEIVISFNGITRDIYERVMKKIDYKVCFDNIMNFIEVKKQKNNSKPKIVLSCIRLADNKHEVRKVRKFWNGKVDQILKPIPENWSGSIEQNSPWKHNFKKKMWPCRGMWDTLDFLWDGRVSLCCRDYDANVIIGDISKSSVVDILKNKRESGYKHLNGDYSISKICYKCDTVVNNAISWW